MIESDDDYLRIKVVISSGRRGEELLGEVGRMQRTWCRMRKEGEG